MITPDTIYLFYYDDGVVWADTDESEDSSGSKYVKIDSAAMNEIKAQAIEEAVKEAMSGSDDPMVKAYANIMRHHANKLRGDKKE